MAINGTPIPVPRDGFAKGLKALYDWLQTLQPASFLASLENITLPAATSTVSKTVYHSRLVSNGVGRVYNMGDGTGITIGHRKLVTLVTRNGSDTVVFDHANMLNAAGTAPAGVVLDAAAEYVLFEYQGAAKWRVIASAAGVVT